MEKRYTIGEEIANAILHGIGALLSILGLCILLLLSSKLNNPLLTISSIIYPITMFLMYFSSTMYHSLTNAKAKKLFRTLDHCAIFLLIAGTYTPFTLVTLKGYVGYSLFAIIWVFAIIGVVLNAIDVKKYSKLSLICYVVMGWAVVFAMKPLVANLELGGLLLLILGGIFYTGGVAFYVSKNKYMHTIWHVFVLLGSIAHYFSVLFYVAR